jgi:predicted GNAT family acetyltransferase
MALNFDQGGTGRYALQDFEPSFGESFRAATEGQRLEEYSARFTSAAEVFLADSGPKLSAADASDYLKTFDFKMPVVPKDNEYSKNQLDIIAARQRELVAINDVRDRTPWGLGTIPRGLAMFAVSMTDPVNVAGAFLPWTKLVQGAAKLRAMQVSSSALTRAGGRVGLGALDAGISTAVLEPFFYQAAQYIGDDYDAVDSMANIAFGTIVGGGIVGVGGAGADVFRRATGRVAPSARFEGMSVDEIQQVQGFEAEVRTGRRQFKSVDEYAQSDIAAELDTRLASAPESVRRALGLQDVDATGIRAAMDEMGNRPRANQVSVAELDGQMTATNLNGFVRGAVDNGVLRITEAYVPEGARGRGNASAMTEALVNRAIDRGLTVETGNAVSREFGNVADSLQRKGFDVERNPTAIEQNGEIVSTDGNPVFRIAQGEGYVKPVDTAMDQVTRADPETREMVFRSGIAQLSEGKNLNIDPIMRTDPNIDGSVTAADIVAAAKAADAPENIGVADFEASAKIDDENAASQKWDTVSDAQQALDEADIILNNAIKDGNDAFKYSRSANAPIADGIGSLGFYSALGRGVDAMATKASTPDGWKSALKGLVNKGLVKQDEIEWTGVNQWLDLQSGKVSKESLQEFLQNNGVKIEEVKLGDLKTVENQINNEINQFDYRVEIEDGEALFFDPDDELVTYVELPRKVTDVIDRYERFASTKYGQYTLPNGENYRELLLTLPSKPMDIGDAAESYYKNFVQRGGEPNWSELPQDKQQEIINSMPSQAKELSSTPEYRSSHWDQPNVLTHIRINDRIDADGAKVLFVEELQSDWAQEGRKKGFITKDTKAAQKEVDVQISETKTQIDEIDAQLKNIEDQNENYFIDDAWLKLTEKRFEATNQISALRQQALDAGVVQPAPFIQDTKSWLSLSLKRVINYAAENGYDKVAFVNGKQSADRYSLSKQVKSIEWSGYESRGATKVVTIYPSEGNAIELPIDANGLVIKTAGTQFDGKPIDEIVGKEIAKQIVEQRGGELSGSGLEVGGEGMIAFYDKIVPNVANDVLKKLGGGKVETVNIVERKALKADKETDELFTQLSGEAPPTEFKANYQQLGFTITPELKAKVADGLPLFAKGAYLGSAKNLTELVTASFGKDTKKMLDAGQIVVVDKVSDIPNGPHPQDVKAATAPDGTVYMVAENISAGEVNGLVLHEVGVHVGMRAMVGDAAFADILKQVDDAIARGESWAQTARDNVPSDTRLADIPEEQLAYLVQNSPELGIVKKIVAAVRAWFYKNFDFARQAMTLTEADFRSLAISSLRMAARQADMQAMGDFAYSRGDIPDTSGIKAELKAEEQNLTRARAYATVLRAAADKLETDASAIAAMKSAMPDITEPEIAELLQGLRKQVNGMRTMTRAAREALMSAQKADDMQSDAMIAANKYAADMEEAAIVEKRNATLNSAARLKLLSFANQFKASGLDAEGFFAILGGSQRARRGARLSVDAEAKSFRSEYLGGMLADLEKAGVKEAFTSGAFDREIYDALYKLGAKKPDMSKLPPEVVTIAEIVNKYQTNARNRNNRFGAWIRDLSGYITRQSHDMYKIRAVNETEWVNFIKDKLDVPKMIRMGLISELDPIGSLRGLYSDFASGIHLKGQAGEADTVAFGQGTNIAKRASVSRALYFKDGISAYEYNEKFGTGRLADSVLHGLEKSAQSAALLKILGTNPEANLVRVMDEYEASLTGERRTKFHEKRGQILNMLKQVDGTVNIPGDVTWAKIGGYLRTWQTMAKLGGSMLSSFSDVAGYAAELRYTQNKNLLSGVGDAIGSLLKGRASGEQADILVSLGVFHESLAGAITQRFDTPELSGKTAYLMRQYFRFNGLTWWTETLRDGAALSHSSFLAKQKGKGFAELTPDVRRALEQYNIDEAKWDLMRQGVMRNADGVDYMTPDAIRTIPRSQLEAYIASVGRTANDTTVQNLIDDLSQTMRTMFLDRAHFAVIEPGARARAFMYRGTQPGTVQGEIMRYITQFKSFSVAMTQMVLGREVYGRGYDTIGEYLRKSWRNGTGDMLGFAYMVGIYTILGYGSMMTKDLLKGRNPRDPLDYKTWMAAAAQSGGLGIYGDFLFGEVARNSGSLVSTIAGPVAGAGDTLMNLIQRMRDGDDTAAASFRALLNNTPFLNIFYLRPLLDYLILFNIQESLNPGFLRRMESRIERENNQTFFIKPSEVVR